MKRLALLMVVPAALVSLAFQATPPPAPAKKPAPPARPSPTPPPVLEGTVKGPDGKPVEKALVIVSAAGSPFLGMGMGTPPLHARTDAAGRFQLQLKSAAPLNVRVEAAGLAAKKLEKVRPGAPLAIVLGKGGTIEGTVRDSRNAPVPKARVIARDEASYGGLGLAEPEAGLVQTVSDAKGQFRLEGLGPGLHTVSARARGVGQGRRASVRLGSRVDLLLLPGGTLFGRVTGPRGEPVAGAAVTTEREERGFSPEGPVVETTDAAGQFEIAGVSPGTYTVVARHKDFAPGVAAGVAVEREASARADVALSAGLKVIGRLVDGEGRPLAGRIGAQDLDGRAAPRALAELVRTEIGADGRIAMPALPPGSYVLAASAPGHAAQRVEVNIPDQGRAPVDVGDVVLETGLTIRGRVRDSAGAGLAGVTLRTFPAGPFPGGFSMVEAQTEGDGRFGLAGLNEGPYRLSASLAGYATKEQRASTGAEAVEIVLTPGGAITGIVADDAGRPIETFSVSAEPVNRGGPGGMIIRGGGDRVVNPEGRFTLEDLGEGSYVLRADAADLAGQSVSGVKVAAGQTTDVGSVRLSRGGVVRGSVVDSTGAPVPGASVFVQGMGNEFMSRPGNPPATTDASGLFEARGVPVGKVDVLASHPNHAGGRVTVDVDPAKGPADARVVLTQGGRIEGWARKRDGTPMPGRIQTGPAQMGAMDFQTRPAMVSVGADGSFVVEHVPPGRVRVMLMQGTASQLSSMMSKEAEVREGETTTVELTTRDILVSGRVSRNGTPVPGVRVNLRSRGGGMMVMSFGPGGGGAPAATTGPQRGLGVTREDGGYELLVDEPGEAFARLESQDGKTSYLNRSETIPDADSHTIDFALTGVQVTGVVVDKQTQKPLAEARVSVTRKESAAVPGPGVSTQTGPDGRFGLELDAGDYKLRTGAEGYAPATVDVSVGEAGLSDMRVELGKGLTIDGRLVDPQGRPVPGLFLTATAVGPGDTRSGGGGTALADGSFRIDGLDSKPYTLVAGSARAGYAVRPGVSPGAKDVVLTLQPGGKARVQVVGPDGLPVERAFVVVRSIAGAPAALPMGGGMTDSQGFSEVDLPAGAVELECNKEKLRGRQTVNVQAGGLVTGQIALSEPAKRTP